ncbi:tetratricopeptide repeat protein [Bacillus sp. OK048]|uniref:tetratricopeptide repeat protein n=1 Tax=Bacillus sp. OK048 TaxID=1882761 RepID=UPI000885E9BB|nr:tetratricopeptide repeat protein [Bacillus sp. OK048]SDM70829.1 Tetratricopeptide repeat-containing protein [Bacillus sp. OK048]
MEAHELPIKESPESKNDSRITKKNDRFTKLQGISLIIATLLISLVGGYMISDKFIWSKQNQDRIVQQVNYYEGLVSKEPNKPEHRVNLGYSYHLNGKSEDAIKQLLVAIDLDKKNVPAYFNLGLVYNDEKRYDDALKQATKAVELAPRDYKGHLLKGMVYRQLKMYTEALASLQEADKLMPVNNDIIFEIGRVAEDQGNMQDAEELYKKALSYDPLYKPASEALTRIASDSK